VEVDEGALEEGEEEIGTGIGTGTCARGTVTVTATGTEIRIGAYHHPGDTTTLLLEVEVDGVLAVAVEVVAGLGVGIGVRGLDQGPGLRLLVDVGVTIDTAEHAYSKYLPSCCKSSWLLRICALIYLHCLQLHLADLPREGCAHNPSD
jgi:hypothetical protein